MREISILRKCPACGSSDPKVYFSAKDPDNLFSTPFTLLHCNLCNLVFIREILKLDNLYTGTYYGDPKSILKPFFNMALHLFILNRIKLIKRYKEGPGKILDIGCGDGAFLSHMNKYGWQVFGIDSSLSASDFMANKNLTLFGKDFLNTNIEAKSMDAVTYWYSFEHLSNPLEYLEKTYTVLKDDGILVISVQNIESFQAIFSGNRWFHLDLPRHILHFSPSTLQRILLNANFRILDIKHSSLQMNIFGWHQSLLNLLGYQPNFFYKLGKRGYIRSKKLLPSFLITLLASPLVFPLSIILAKLEEFYKRGGVITAIAKKRL